MKRKVLLVVLCVILLVLVTSLYVAAQGPTITIYEPLDGIIVQTPTITLRATVESPEGHPLEHLEVRVNGFPVLWKDKGVDPVLPGEIYEEVQLEEGENQIAIIATNDLGSTEQAIIVTYIPSRLQMPNLCILAIGISDYERDEFNLDLSYAAIDAQDIVDAFATQAVLFFDKVKTRLLLNEEAGEDNILDSLDWMLRETKQYDMAIIFVSGHGHLHELTGDYYFLPHDGDPERLRSTAILWSQFENVLKRLPGLSVLFVDTCHAGGVTGTGTKSAAVNLKAIQDFATAGRGWMAMTSSTEVEFSREDPAWGHGAFTKAILDGLAGGADYNRNDIIDTFELNSYVTNRVQELTGGAQHPTTETSTNYAAFPLFVLAWGGAEPTSTPVIATPRAVETPLPPIDTPTPTCADAAAFVTDVTVPDNTIFNPGEQFDKVWRLRNSGSCAWGEGYSLVFVSGDQMDASASQPVPATAPGETADISVTMYAPQTDDTYTGVWQMQDPSGQLFGQRVTVVIGVGKIATVVSSTPTPTDFPADFPPLSGKITYALDDGIYVMNADGTNKQKIFEGGVNDLSATPDGKKIAFLRNGEIWTMGIDGSNQQKIIYDSQITSVDIRSDAEYIAYSQGNTIYYKRIVDPGTSYITEPINIGTGTRPDLSTYGRPVFEGTSGLSIADSLQTSRSLTQGYGSWPDWAPDDVRIAFVKDGDIFVINMDGSGETHLTNNPANDWQPNWSPDGDKITFISDRDGNQEIYVMSSDGSKQVRITNTPENENWPSWSQ